MVVVKAAGIDLREDYFPMASYMRPTPKYVLHQA